MAKKRLIVVALGGNAISQPHEEGNVDQQFDNSAVTARALADLIDQGHRLVITHGNGPQIGNFLLRNEAGAGHIYSLPMELAVSHVQGGMGYMIAQSLTNELARRSQDRVVTTIITTVLVDGSDPAFANPTKPIGRILTKDEADGYQRDQGWRIKEISPGKYRRIVASPLPKRIMELETIRRAIEAGDLLVACGGGGVPVIRDPEKGLRGIRAIIDKDLAGAMLAIAVGADAIMFLTNVDRVSVNFGKPGQREIERMSIDEAQKHLADGQFPPGSMGPKVQGAINFLRACENPDAIATIGHLFHAADALAGETGTRITKN